MANRLITGKFMTSVLSVINRHTHVDKKPQNSSLSAARTLYTCPTINIFMCVCLVINILVMIVITWFIQASWLPCTNIKITSKHFTLITKSKERIYDFMGHIIQYDLQNHVSRDVFVIFYFTYFLYCAGCSLPHLV